MYLLLSFYRASVSVYPTVQLKVAQVQLKLYMKKNGILV